MVVGVGKLVSMCKFSNRNEQSKWLGVSGKLETLAHWAIPEINGNPPPLKKTWDSQNLYSSFPVGIPKINYPFDSRKGKEDMGISNF